MPTNPQAAGQAKITFQISEEEKAVLQQLAAASNMKLSAYVRLILLDAISSGTTYTYHRIKPPPEPLSYVAESPDHIKAIKAELSRRQSSKKKQNGHASAATS